MKQMKQPTREVARNKWHSILPQMGIDRAHLVNRHGPCPICGGNDRFRYDNKHGNGDWYCNQCGAGDGFRLLIEVTGRPFSEVAAEVDRMVGNIEPENHSQPRHDSEKVKNRLMSIGKALQPVKFGDPVHQYLSRRGIAAIPYQHIRLHPEMPYYDGGKFAGVHPAMVAPFRAPNGTIESFHITYLTKDGHKAEVSAPKKAMTPIHGLGGCAIRLSEPAARIAICEGIETALSITALYQIPCWATYSANGLEQFQPPESVSEIVIYADVDASFTGQKAAFTAAHNLHRKGYSVSVADLIYTAGVDYNDLLLDKQRSIKGAA